MKLKHLNKVGYIAIGLIIGIALSARIGTADDNAGTVNDPLVTVSYMAQQMEALESRLTSEINQKMGTVTAVDPVVFEVINVPAGTSLYFGASTEFIVRVGEAKVIDPNDVGIPDLTAGSKVDNGVIIPVDHHLLVPSDDGRGIKIVTDSWLMVKGDYTESDN
jgi:hypothetical protein